MKILGDTWKISMFVILSFGISLTSCTKKAQTIGLEIKPTDNFDVKTIDTSTLVAYSVIQDSMLTSNYTRILLGSMKDPVFGQTTANYYTQIQLTTGYENFNFGDNPVVDSLVFSLAYNGYYGDTTTPQTLKVYELNEKLNSDSGYYYYSKDQASHYPTAIGSLTFTPKPNTPVVLEEGDTTIPLIQINLMELTPEFGNKLISTPQDILQSNEKFMDYINGLCIISEPVNEGGAILYVDLGSYETRLTLYYSNDSSSGNVYNMSFYDSIASFNNFDHNNYVDASPEFKAQVLEGDTSLGQENIYVQSLGGVITKISFPFIKNLKAIGDIAINSAELVAKGVENNNGNQPPVRMALVEINPDGTSSQSIIDMEEGDAYFGGYYDSTRNEYRFQIARYIQQLISDKKTDYGIYLKNYGSSTSGGQFILHGTNPALPTSYSDRLKLNITYTLIK